jgi:putative DNA methylase
MTERRTLIEVSLPIDGINAARAREKTIRHGHASTIHLWGVPRPMAAGGMIRNHVC